MATTRDGKRRRSISIARIHKDGSECTHRIAPSGKPRPGEDCPGAAGYKAVCRCCGWTFRAGVRACVEEQVASKRREVVHQPVTPEGED